LVEHVGGQDALVIQDDGGNTPLHYALDRGLSPQIIQFLAYKSMPQNGRGMPTLDTEHALCMRNEKGYTPLHIAMSGLYRIQEYDTVLYLVQLDATALGTVCYGQQTPLMIAAQLALQGRMSVSVLKRLVQSYPPALVVQCLVGGDCRFPLVHALQLAKTLCPLDTKTLIEVLGLLIDRDRVVMRRHGDAPTPYELAVAEGLDPRVVNFLRHRRRSERFAGKM